jgi:hypothetical protein
MTGWPAIESLRPAGVLRDVIDETTWGVQSMGSILYVSRTVGPVRGFVLGRDGRRVEGREIALPDDRTPPDAFVGTDHVLDGVVVRRPMSGARVVVRDGATLDVRSETVLLDRDYPGQQMGYAGLHRGRLVLGSSTLWDGRTSIVTYLLDARDGQLVARVDGVIARAVQGDCVLGTRRRGEVVALDLATGAEVGALRYTTTEPAAAEIVAAGRRIAAVSFDGELVLLDAGDGREVARRARPGADARVWLAGAAGDRLFLAEERPDGPDSATELIAMSIDDGRELWRSAPLLHHVETDATPFLLATDEDAIIVCAAGVLRALDPVTGAERFRYGHPAGLDCRAMVAVRPDPDGPAVIAAVDPPDVRFFARGGPALRPVESVVLGTVRAQGGAVAGARLRIGDVSVTADARGRFVAAVTGRGAVPVELLEPRAPFEHAPRFIRLVPGRVRVTVRLRRCDDCD